MISTVHLRHVPMPFQRLWPAASTPIRTHVLLTVFVWTFGRAVPNFAPQSLAVVCLWLRLFVDADPCLQERCEHCEMRLASGCVALGWLSSFVTGIRALCVSTSSLHTLSRACGFTHLRLYATVGVRSMLLWQSPCKPSWERSHSFSTGPHRMHFGDPG